jgi:hypothetical protein
MCSWRQQAQRPPPRQHQQWPLRRALSRRRLRRLPPPRLPPSSLPRSAQSAPAWRGWAPREGQCTPLPSSACVWTPLGCPRWRRTCPTVSARLCPDPAMTGQHHHQRQQLLQQRTKLGPTGARRLPPLPRPRDPRQPGKANSRSCHLRRRPRTSGKSRRWCLRRARSSGSSSPSCAASCSRPGPPWNRRGPAWPTASEPCPATSCCSLRGPRAATAAGGGPQPAGCCPLLRAGQWAPG